MPNPADAASPDALAGTAGEVDMTKLNKKKPTEHTFKVGEHELELELKLIATRKIDDYIFMPSDIRKIWQSPRLKDELVKFF